MTDPIADMLTRIRNATAVNKVTVRIPFSQLKKEIARVMKDEGYIEDVSVEEASVQRTLVITLRYLSGRVPAIRSIQRVSTPGCRVYAKAGDMPVVRNNIGLAIISTSHGIMTNSQAKHAGVGGEVLCEIH
ncbi:MAG: 30S ribosomal protein S8 [bacterium]|nr:30S ribosomal protein S8 [bacterium]